MSECPDCFKKLRNGECVCGYKEKRDGTVTIDRCVICGEPKDLLPVGIKRNGQCVVDWYCEPHYLKRVERMSKTSGDLSWCTPYHGKPIKSD